MADQLDPSYAPNAMILEGKQNLKLGTNDSRRDWGLDTDESANRLLARMNNKVDKMIGNQNVINFKKPTVSKKVYM